MIVERGLREKAEVTAQANKEMAAAVIQGEREKEVARLAASKKVQVAEQEKLEADQKKLKAVVEAEQKKEVANILLIAADKEAQAIKLLALAEEERIQRAGALTERDRVLAGIEMETRIGQSRELAKINVPQFIIAGGSDGQGGSVMGSMLNMVLLKSLGLLPADGTVPEAINKVVPAPTRK